MACVGRQKTNRTNHDLIIEALKDMAHDAARKNFNQSLANMSAFSNSSPVEGIEQALRIYAPKAEKLAIYVLGDDFTGGDFEAALYGVDQLNTKNGERIARIHAIGFPWGQGDRFSTLMREMAHRNNGVFLGL